MRKPILPMVTRLPITKARINLGQLAKRAHIKGEYFILEKDGIPVIGIMGADEMEDYLELKDPKVNRQLDKSNQDIRAGRVRPAAELLANLRRQKQRSQSKPSRKA